MSTRVASSVKQCLHSKLEIERTAFQCITLVHAIEFGKKRRKKWHLSARNDWREPNEWRGAPRVGNSHAICTGGVVYMFALLTSMQWQSCEWKIHFIQYFISATMKIQFKKWFSRIILVTKLFQCSLRPPDISCEPNEWCTSNGFSIEILHAALNLSFFSHLVWPKIAQPMRSELCEHSIPYQVCLCRRDINFILWSHTQRGDSNVLKIYFRKMCNAAKPKCMRTKCMTTCAVTRQRDEYIPNEIFDSFQSIGEALTATIFTWLDSVIWKDVVYYKHCRLTRDHPIL